MRQSKFTVKWLWRMREQTPAAEAYAQLQPLPGSLTDQDDSAACLHRSARSGRLGSIENIHSRCETALKSTGPASGRHGAFNASLTKAGPARSMCKYRRKRAVIFLPENPATGAYICPFPTKEAAPRARPLQCRDHSSECPLRLQGNNSPYIYNENAPSDW